MNIVHLVESLDTGGLERVVVSLANAQRKQGHAMTVVCLFHGGELAAELRALGIDVVLCHKRKGLDWRAVRTIRDTLRGTAADVLHTHNPVPHYYGVLAAIGMGVGCKLNTRHGMGMFPFSWKRELLYRLAMFGSDYGVAVCKAAQINFQHKGIIPVSKGRCIPNGIELDSFARRTSTAKSQLLADLGRTGEPLVFGIVGRLNAAKDHACLLQAMALLVKQRTDVHLVVVGDGECRGELEEMALSLGLTQFVTFLGRRDDVSHLLTAFDVFVLSSRTEGYSLALVEAAATALPIIATNVGGNGEIVTDGVTGRLIEKEDPRALCDAMLQLAGDLELRVAMGSAGRVWALQVGSLDAMARAYENLFDFVRVSRLRIK